MCLRRSQEVSTSSLTHCPGFPLTVTPFRKNYLVGFRFSHTICSPFVTIRSSPRSLRKLTNLRGESTLITFRPLQRWTCPSVLGRERTLPVDSGHVSFQDFSGRREDDARMDRALSLLPVDRILHQIHRTRHTGDPTPPLIPSGPGDRLLTVILRVSRTDSGSGTLPPTFLRPGPPLTRSGPTWGLSTSGIPRRQRRRHCPSEP